MTAGRPASSREALAELLDLRPAGASADGPDRARLGVVGGRFLVPLDFPDASPQACLAYLGLRDRKTQVSRGAVGLALRFGLDRLVVGEELTADRGPGSLIARLEELLGPDDDGEPGLAVAAGLSRIDEVWKPTLQVFRPDGEPAAFVKIGLGPVGDRLVGTEAEALAAWSRHPDPRLVVPDLIADTTWNGLRLAVVAPLPEDARRLPPGTPSAWAVRALEGETESSLSETGWWTSRRKACADQPKVDEILARIEDRHGSGAHRWARWHGDWVPWNLARCHRGLIAWDWEYSEPSAPVGLDEVHGAYQQAHVVEGASITLALSIAHAGVDRWLADAHVAMLVTRSAELERLLGRPPGGQAELLAAAQR